MRTRRRRPVAGLLVACACTLVLTACNAADTPPPTTTTIPTETSAPTTSTTTSTTTAPTISAADPDLRAAEDAVTRYWAVFDQLAADPAADLKPIATVASGQAADQSRIRIDTYRAKRWTQVGVAVVKSPKAVMTGRNSFSVTACIDVSKVDFLDEGGDSVVATQRPDEQAYTYTVAKSGSAFLVTIDTLKGRAC